jgi:hypothetical protein
VKIVKGNGAGDAAPFGNCVPVKNDSVNSRAPSPEQEILVGESGQSFASKPINIEIWPISSSIFGARFGRHILCRSRQPLLDATRKLIELGYRADTPVAMRHAGSKVVALCATIGMASQLTVEERDRRPPRFAPWKARNLTEGSPLIEFPAEPVSDESQKNDACPSMREAVQ